MVRTFLWVRAPAEVVAQSVAQAAELAVVVLEQADQPLTVVTVHGVGQTGHEWRHLPPVSFHGNDEIVECHCWSVAPTVPRAHPAVT